MKNTWKLLEDEDEFEISDEPAEIEVLDFSILIYPDDFVDGGKFIKYTNKYGARVRDADAWGLGNAAGALISAVDEEAREEIRNSCKEIIIKDGVKDIGANAFAHFRKLTKINIPEGVVRIGYSAFYNCTSLKSITLPNSIVSLDGGCFSNSGLERIVIPDKVARLQYCTFLGCFNLKEVSIPEHLSVLEDEVFADCRVLESITLPRNLFRIDNEVFRNCVLLKSIVIPVTVSDVGHAIVKGCPDITIYCEASEEPNRWSFTWNGTGGFFGNMFANVEWGYNKTIDEDIDDEEEFDISDEPVEVDTVDLNNFKYPSDYHLINGTDVWDDDRKQIIHIIVEDGVEVLPQGVFSEFSNLKSISLPKSLKIVGYEAFYGCRALKEVVLPDGVTRIEQDSFYGCHALERFIIPKSVVYVQKWIYAQTPKLTIYCEVKNKPEGWEPRWNYANIPVVWDYKNKK